ncbi:hypothetical protein Tco_0359454 [Tanacetum coccineum]
MVYNDRHAHARYILTFNNNNTHVCFDYTRGDIASDTEQVRILRGLMSVGLSLNVRYALRCEQVVLDYTQNGIGFSEHSESQWTSQWRVLSVRDNIVFDGRSETYHSDSVTVTITHDSAKYVDGGWESGARVSVLVEIIGTVGMDADDGVDVWSDNDRSQDGSEKRESTTEGLRLCDEGTCGGVRGDVRVVTKTDSHVALGNIVMAPLISGSDMSVEL